MQKNQIKKNKKTASKRNSGSTKKQTVSSQTKTKSRRSIATTKTHTPISSIQNPIFGHSTRPMSSAPEQPKSTIYNRAVVLKPVGEHKRTVFFLHGLGDEGQSFIDVFQMLALKNTKVILPNAPRIPITCNGKYQMPGWYDLVSLGDDREFGKNEDVTGINHTVEQLEIAIDHEASLVGGHSNIIIGGFSQGSAVSQLTAARLKNKLGGVIALSGYALLSSADEATNPINTKDTPYFIYHGKDDEVVSINFARQSKAYWESKGLSNIQYSEEPGLGHSLSRDEIGEVKKFLTKAGFV